MNVKAIKENLNGNVSLDVPELWTISPKSFSFSLKEKGEEQNFEFVIKPPFKASEVFINPVVQIGDKKYTDELVEINYDHIPFQSVIMPSEAKMVRLNIEKKGQIIGYIQGAGDAVPTSLRQMGYTVVELNEDDITPEKLENFDAIVLGIRAYNTNDRAKFYQKFLHRDRKSVV